jgi:cyclophilin family peptidyl-prolyl cis-trans isomerase
MRILIALILTLALMPLAVAQAYKPKSGETVLKLEVDGRGSIYVLLHTKEAPKTTSHITGLVKNSFYNGQRFHRIEKSPRPYLVQTGDPASKQSVDAAGNGGSGGNVPYEDSGFSHKEGAVGLATVGDRRDSQFYIMLAPAKFLDGKYTVFGQVVAGMDVVRSLEKGDKITSISIVSG